MKKPLPDQPADPRDLGHADAHGDFYFDELMTPQPDATREFFRARLENLLHEKKDQES